MIVPRKGNETEGYRPDIPEGTVFKSCYQNDDGTYTLTDVEYINGVPVTITAFQGIEQLRKLGKYNAVLEIINGLKSTDPDMGEKMENAMKTILIWQRHSETIQYMAASVGVELDAFFIEAKKIKLP